MLKMWQLIGGSLATGAPMVQPTQWLIRPWLRLCLGGGAWRFRRLKPPTPLSAVPFGSALE